MSTIRAKVSPNLLQNSDLLFNQSPAETLRELLQNSRRARATHIEVEVTNTTHSECHVTLLDNGIGIKDPQSLLHLGESGWDPNLKKKETPAGMGFFSLCHLPSGVTVRSQGWKAHIDKAAFKNKKPVKIQKSPHLTGTELKFSLPLSREVVLSHIAILSLHLPISVTLNKKPVAQEKFLKGCKHTKSIPGGILGILPHGTNEINFHGTKIVSPISDDDPLLPSCFPFKVLVDVEENHILDLLLPSRREVVQNEKWENLKREARKFAYEILTKEKVQHELPFEYWNEAQSMNIELQEAKPYLITAPQRGVDDYFDLQIFESGIDRSFAINVKTQKVALAPMDPIECLAVHLALATQGNLPSPVTADPKMVGYSWYPTESYHSACFLLEKDGETIEIQPAESGQFYADLDIEKKETWPDKITLKISLKKGDKVRHITMPSIVAFTTSDEWNEEAIWNSWVLQKGTQEKSIPELENLIFALTFQPSDSGEADSYDTQKMNQEECISSALIQIFQGRESSNKQTLLDAMNAWNVAQSAHSLKLKEVTFHLKGGQWVIKSTVKKSTRKKSPAKK